MGFDDTTGGDCTFCYSHSSYFAERPNKYLKEFNTIWVPIDKKSNPSLPEVLNSKQGDK